MWETFETSCPAIECEGCAASIRRSLGRLPGVRETAVDVDGKSVKVTYDPGLVGEADLRARLTAAGFPPVP